MSILNTRFSRCAQVIDVWRSAGASWISPSSPCWSLALGYFIWESRFTGRVKEETPAGQAATTTGDDTLAALAADIEKSIAVLPVTTRSEVENDKFFSDGMHDNLLTQLAKIGDLKVISRTSVMEYRDTARNLRQIGAELGVANIMEGAIQRSYNPRISPHT